MIGFTGSAFSLSTGAQKNLRAQMDALREVGCQLIVHSMHAGTEYEREPTSQQKTVAAHAVDMGADLVVGHHPHVVQGYELVDGVPVVYSLGNAVFGGNRDPRDYDALLLQAVFAYEDGAPVSVRLVFHPISVSGEQATTTISPYCSQATTRSACWTRWPTPPGSRHPPTKRGRGRRRRRLC